MESVGFQLARWLARPGAPETSPYPNEIDRLARTLRPGDVLLVEGQSRIADVVRYLTQSTWSHAALCVGGHTGLRDEEGRPMDLIEADLVHGVRAISQENYAGMHTRICRPNGLCDSEIQSVVEHAASRVGQQYDLKNVLDLARYLFPVLPVPRRWRRKLLALGSGDPTRAICSTLVAEAFQSVRYPILPRIEQRPSGDPDCAPCVEEIAFRRHPSLFVPRDFDISPYFSVIKPALPSGFDPHRVRWGD